MTELKIEWNLFKNSLNELSEKGKIILENNPRTKEDIEIFFEEYKSWRKDVLEFLTNSFEPNNSFAQGFRIANSNNFHFQGTQKSDEQLIRENKQFLRSDLRILEYTLKILSVSEKIISPNKIDLTIRENYTSEEILNLLLEKLYEIYDDNIYPILPILEGNGIILKKRREEFEYLKILENNGYVISNNIGNQADAQLTVSGKIYVEEKRKIVIPNYETISNDKENIDKKIDELFIKLEKLGYGQEIIFEELEELKDLYLTLNKQNWAQLVKGKIIDLGLSQVISVDIMKIIYESITNDILRLP
ncbi:hypothetical protein HUE46_10745 [Flavobacterium columnare]|nr:hypothetical protein [Flavobacterium columnare]QOG90436.1 hypothetical protein HUE41_10745 [Flavobacterium columnare]QOG93092.1 hypothetical protein HUE42_10740 [Flavobacterium columnare]QOG95757.1 hypothetical protein HUE43_10740 [Flavobacterium columnare]QOG98417.1 hypothetical protein HUE44_10740 [Flavobacterium columnare]QOH01076.1 hypothetical protein HUE45_10740 [Flavobacterium columnare]